MTRMDQIVVKFYQACCCHCCIGLIEHYIGVSLADTCSYFVPVQCTSHSCVGSRLVMSICSRGRLQGQLNSWVTSSEKTLASKLLPVSSSCGIVVKVFGFCIYSCILPLILPLPCRQLVMGI